LAFAAGRQAVVPSCGPLAYRHWEDAARDEARGRLPGDRQTVRGRRASPSSTPRCGNGSPPWIERTRRLHRPAVAGGDSRASIARAKQIAAFASVLRSVDARGVERATGAAATVGELDSCSMTAPPRDPVAAAVVERELAHVQALLLVGRMSEAQTAAAPLVEKATALDHPPLLAPRSLRRRTPGCEAGDPRDGVDALYRAARAASAGHDDVLAVKIYIKLVYCAGAKDANLAAAQALIETAEAALERNRLAARPARAAVPRGVAHPAARGRIRSARSAWPSSRS
jgi:hypothetical protein